MEENFFSKKMVTKTNHELETIINNKSQFQEAAVLAAIWELEKRGLNEYQNLEQEIVVSKATKENLLKRKTNITDDPSAPQLYPRWSIIVISGLFTPLIGGILMAMNFKRIGKAKQIPIVIGFSVFFTILVIVLVNYLQERMNTISSMTNLLNLIGVAILDQYFWNNQIGKEFKHRKRSPLVPFLISIAITAFFVWASLQR